MSWRPFKIPNDRLGRWSVINAADPGIGKTVIATGIRGAEAAHLLAASREMLEALEASPPFRHQLPGGVTCTCGQCAFVTLRDRAIAKATALAPVDAIEVARLEAQWKALRDLPEHLRASEDWP